ncbi:hypothetical protein FBQ84_02410 [Ignavibacteria bacterium CHB1]|nr:MAG: hypothetical protein EDM69_02880 [Chlorobiota bacterium]MBV6397912.1 hypothetical protein [Ignavibacteria bacterium]MCC6886357.1 hypothetical protein [Ignavibacteriales bacterium]MCE7952568.1 hypothetical protein [Chlorobi bacterium CHB7]MDL1886682.1 hypothetical protein [Ignavibacteria bacterium CHB1]RIK47984.1 MAG: hypothetical protein DCC60_08865 [Ignavibacteriota bacterium]
MMRTIIKSIILFVIATSILRAQTDEFEPGSPYTIFGVGELNYSNSLRTRSMGINGIGLSGDYVNSLNPAANYDMSYTRISLNGKYSFYKYSDATSTGQDSDGKVDGLNIGIPISNEKGISLFLGFNRLSSVGYQITQIEQNTSGNETRFYSGKGGLSKINVGLTYKLANSVVLGAEYNYAFGNIIDSKKIDFGLQGVTNTDIRKEIDLQNSYFKGGAIIEIGNLVKSKLLKDLKIGFYYQTKINFNSAGDAIYTTSTSTDTVRITGEPLEFPASFGFGISNKFGNRYIVSADLLMHNWENFQSTKITVAKYENSYQLGLGLEILPLSESDVSYWNKLTYRMGVFYGKEYYSVNNNDINVLGASTGVNIPLTNQNSIDLAIMYLIRGKNSDGLIKDENLSLALGFNFGELWFLKRQEEN